MLCALKKEFFQGLESVQLLNIDSVIKILTYCAQVSSNRLLTILLYCIELDNCDFMQGNGIHWIVVVSLMCGTLLSNLWLRKMMQQKNSEYSMTIWLLYIISKRLFSVLVQLMKLVEGAAHINFKNDVLSANMADMTTAAEELEGNLISLSAEKEDQEQRGITLKVTV